MRRRGASPSVLWGATLRARLVTAFVLTSLATLAAATFVLLPVLEHRLISDRLSSLRDLGRTARPALQAIPEGGLRAGSPDVRHIVDRLERRTGGRIAIYDERTLLVDTAHDRPSLGAATLREPIQRAMRSKGGLVAGRRGDIAFVVSVTHDGPELLTLVIAKRLDDTRAAAAVVRAATPGALAAGLLVAIGLALLLSRSLSRRLARLRADAQALGTEGLQHPIEVAGADEVAVVAAALEDLRVRLREEESSRQAFVSTASHELRTPLASLLATLELLREELGAGDADPAVTVPRAETALRQTHRLVSLTTDLLDLSRVDGAAALAPEPLEVAEVAHSVAPGIEDRLAAAGRALRVTGGPVIAVADPAALARILGILLENAYAYGAGDVSVAIGPETEEGTVEVAVADEGPGLSADEHDEVFVRFTRGSASAGTSGTGLGLAIGRGLARGMGGELSAAPSGRGARFVLTLPAWRGEESQAAEPGEAASDHELRTPR